MKTKTCSRCKITQPTSNFCKATRIKDGVQPACKTCMTVAWTNSRKKKHYQDVITKRRHRYVERFNAWKSTQHCMLCFEDDHTCLDFHRLDSNEKDVNISDVSNAWSFERLQTELLNCVIICSNCHRKVHAGK